MQIGTETRVKASVALLILSVLGPLLLTVSRMNIAAPYRQNRIVRYGERLAPLRAMLPPQTIVGYVSEDTSLWSFYQTRYFVAPTLVDRSVGHDLVIGTTLSGSFNADWLARHRLVLKRDFGNGIMLFERTSR